MTLEHAVHAAVVAHAISKAERPHRVPAAAYPMTTELEYGNKLVALVRRLKTAYQGLIGALPHLLASTAQVYGDVGRYRTDEGEAAQAKAILDRAQDRAGDLLTVQEIEALALFYAGRTSQAQQTQLAKQIRAALGVDIPVIDPAADRELLSYFAHENVQLILSVSTDLQSQIANVTARGFTEREDPAKLAELIENRFAVAESRARFIARDQIGKLNGQLAMVRMRNLGVDDYTWQTMGDSHVRPEHRARQGKRYSFSRPPADGNPGEPPGCRCTAIPVLDALRDAIAERLK